MSPGARGLAASEAARRQVGPRTATARTLYGAPVMAIGEIQSLLRYPVKSMAGEALDAAAVVPEHGLQGDRAFALLDPATGRIASAKHPRRWAGLLECRAAFDGPLAPGQRHGPVRITLPDGSTVRSDAADVDAALGRALGRAVRLVDTPPPQVVHDELGAGERDGEVPLAVGSGPGTFFDFAPLHLIATASLRHLRAGRPGSDFAVARFRPNLVVDTGPAVAPGFVEHAWVGQVLAIGDEVRVCVTFSCPRCVMPTLAQGALPADPAVLRAVAENPQMFALRARKLPSLGVYAHVVRGGTVRVGDVVRPAGRAPLRRVAALLRSLLRAVRR